MERHKKAIKIVVIVVVCVLVVLYVARVAYINLIKYPHPEQLTYSVGEQFELSDIKFEITEVILQKESDEDYYLIGELILTNLGDEDVSYLVPSISVNSSGLWSNGLSSSKYAELNEEQSPYVIIPASGTVTVYIPFNIAKDNFRYTSNQFLDDLWYDVETWDYSFIFSVYPSVNIVTVSASEYEVILAY